MSLGVLIKSGAILSTIGVALLVTFVIILLAFPVIKICNNSEEKCIYSSTAPDQLSAIIQPEFLAVSLMIMAAGILMIRFAGWKSHKKSEVS